MIDEYNYNDEPPGRVDTLAMALDKCERLEKQLEITITALGGVKGLLRAGFTQIAQEVIEKAFNEIKESEK